VTSQAVRYTAAALGAASVVMLIALGVVPASARSGVVVGGTLGLAVQVALLPFLFRRLTGANVLAALGLAMGCRFLVFGVAAFALVPALALPLGPTLFTLAGVFFVTTLLEPVLLAPQPLPRR
jgi:hypothetical protein